MKMLSESFLKNIKQSLEVSELKAIGPGGGGCINEGDVYASDIGKLFLKRNDKSEAESMFRGEQASLEAIRNTGVIRAPKPYTVIVEPQKEKCENSTVVLVMEYLDLKGSKAGAALGAQIADLHLHNQNLLSSPSTSRITTLSNDDPAEESDSRGSSSLIHEKRFGFHVPTSCGYIAQNNSWCDDWPSLITRKLDEQIHKLQSESRPGREALLLWPALQRVIPSLFDDLKEPIIPSLLHGDLWTGNVGSVTEDGVSKPVVFDPASFYGHHEYDLAIAGMFGGFGSAFWSSYFDRIPKQAGWDRRHKLYQLFHYLNHWNHFGSGYASSSLGIMRELTK